MERQPNQPLALFGQFSSGGTIIDITGYYDTVGAGGLTFYPLTQPVRELDTRAGQSAFVHRLGEAKAPMPILTPVLLDD